MPIVEYLDYQIPVTHYVGVPRLSDTRYSKVEYLDYQIPVTQQKEPKENGDIQTASEVKMRHLPAVDRFKRYGR